MSNQNDLKILGTDEAWESGKLGEDLNHAKVASKEMHEEINKIITPYRKNIKFTPKKSESN